MKHNNNHFDYTGYESHSPYGQGYQDSNFTSDVPEFGYDDVFKSKQNNMNIKKDFLQAIGSVFGATNQHATQINYNINMFSTGLESLHAGSNFMMGEVFPASKDAYEISPMQHTHRFRSDGLNVQTKESREQSPMVIRQHQIFEDQMSPLVRDEIMSMGLSGLGRSSEQPMHSNSYTISGMPQTKDSQQLLVTTQITASEDSTVGKKRKAKANSKKAKLDKQIR